MIGYALEAKKQRKGKQTEALIADLEVPEVDSKVIRRDERLRVAVHGDRVDVVGMRVGKHSLWHVREHLVLGGELGQAELWARGISVGHHSLDLLLIDFPQLDGFVFFFFFFPKKTKQRELNKKSSANKNKKRMEANRKSD